MLRDWDFDRVESSRIIKRDGGGMTVKLTVLDGGHDEGVFTVSLNAYCSAIAIEELQTFTAVTLGRDCHVLRVELTGAFTP